MRGWILGIMVAAGVILGLLALLFAQGAPTPPVTSLSTPIQPGTAQSLAVQIQTGFYSISAPNTVWSPGWHFIYTVVEQTNNGPSTVLANNVTASPNLISTSGGFYVMSSAITVGTVSVCSGAACSGVTENITITAKADVVTPYVAWFSPNTVSLFLSSNSQSCSASSPCYANSAGAPQPAHSPQPCPTATDTFLAEVLVPFSILIGVELIAAYAVVLQHPALPVVGALFLVAAVVEVFAFGIL